MNHSSVTFFYIWGGLYLAEIFCQFIFVKQTNELIREKEHVDISDTAKFQSSGPNAGEMADIRKTRQ